MAFFDFLTGRRGLRKARNRAKDFARERYNPNQVQPLVSEARTRATEGLTEGQEVASREALSRSLFRDQEFEVFGGNAAAAIAGNQANTISANEALAGFEREFAAMDEAAMQQGRLDLAQATARGLELAGLRDAAIEEADMNYEAELSRRRGTLIGQAVSAAGALLSIPTGGTSLVASEAINSMTESARAGVPNQAPSDDILEDQIDFSIPEQGLDMSPISLPGSGIMETSDMEEVVEQVIPESGNLPMGPEPYKILDFENSLGGDPVSEQPLPYSTSQYAFDPQDPSMKSSFPLSNENIATYFRNFGDQFQGFFGMDGEAGVGPITPREGLPDMGNFNTADNTAVAPFFPPSDSLDFSPSQRQKVINFLDGLERRNRGDLQSFKYFGQF